jgi:hypothetical protein
MGSALDTVARVREYILSNPDVYNDTSKFILGGGWDHTIWPTTGWPTAVFHIFLCSRLYDAEVNR